MSAPHDTGPQAPAIVKTNPDPTYNVMQLVLAAVTRLDDLRDADNKRIDEVMNLRAHFAERLETAESRRIDAIRAVDVNAVAVASERQAAAAGVLANQVAQSADALRTLVSTTAAAMAEQQRQLVSQITDRLTVVERSQYEGRGKEIVTAPQYEEVLREIRELRSARQLSAGKSEGINVVWVAVTTVLGLLIGAIAVWVSTQ